jgi:hypothetical protein
VHFQRIKSFCNPPLVQYGSLKNISLNGQPTDLQLNLHSAHKLKASGKGRSRPEVEWTIQIPALIFVYQEV